MYLQTYIQNLQIPQIFKDSILDINFSKNNPDYYQNYPSLFSKAFSVRASTLKLLDIAGYFYYQATIFTDNLIDEQDLSKFPLITICQEESIKILTSIYGLKNNFWNLWNKRRNEYFQAILLEKELFKKESITIEEYEILADKKSAFGKVAIDCLFTIDDRNVEDYNLLMLSHKYFSVAFQLNDDIQDFKNDLINCQFNYAVYLLKKQNVTTSDPVILEKYLYIKGISKQIYLLGIEYCNKALDIVSSIDVPSWKGVLKETTKTFKTAIIEIDNYIEILTSEIKQSDERLLENDLNKCINGAINYIKENQKTDGSWREYLNQGGISNIWSTAFVIVKVSENQELNKIFKNEIKKAIDFLNGGRLKKIWGYNTNWIEDADSTNFVFLSLILNKSEIDPDLFKIWLGFQKSDNGFSTYSNGDDLLRALDDKNILNVDGWISSHNCVSAVSFYFLANYNQKDQNFTKIKKYFEEDFETKAKSYWWSSDIYTYYYLAKTYFLIKDFKKLSFFIEKIKLIQNENGSFSDAYGENLFYTGLALEILLLNKNSVLEVKKAVGYLLQNQYKDGSWSNSHALQIPNSQNEKSLFESFPVATFGMNVRAKEFNRLFTTSTILQSIIIYGQQDNSKALLRY